LIEGGKRVLPSYAESLSKKAATRLGRLGVKVMTNAIVEKVNEQGVTVAGRLIKSATVFWTAGVAPSPIVKLLGGETDRAGRACVGGFMNLVGADGVFVIGDSSSVIQDSRPVPGVAQAAIQQGRYVARYIAAEIKGRSAPAPFRYSDKGSIGSDRQEFRNPGDRPHSHERVLSLARLGIRSHGRSPSAAKPHEGSHSMAMVLLYRAAQLTTDV
jgi:NADH dehydrogenase